MSDLRVQLRQGAKMLSLTSGRYLLADDFVPPPVATVPLLAEGTSANRRGGASKRGERALPRAWGFGVHVLGASEREVRRGVQDLHGFLAWAGDPSEPLYVELYPNTDAPLPLWGQGVLRYEVVHGAAALSPLYGVMSAREYALPDCRVSLTVQPEAVGLSQRVASATGGVLLDNYGTTDGRARGVIIPEATTNKMTNPVFGNSTPGNGWTAGGSLTAETNTDPAFLLPGTRASIKLTRLASVSWTYTQSLNVGNTNTHTLSCYAKKPDGSAVTASDLQLVYNTAQTTVYTAVGDGWYRLTWSGAGINASTITGVILSAVGKVVYVAGFQLEEKAYATPLAWGDLLGCAWTGTAHASTSTRTAARIRLAVASDTLHAGAGTITVVWQAPLSSANLSGNVKLFDDAGSTNFRFGWVDASNTWLFSDGTNSISSSADTFSAGDVLIFHVTWQAGALAVYKNGAVIASGSSFTPPTLGSYLYLGSNNGPAVHSNGTYMDFRTYAVPLTAAEVLADYTNVVQVTTDSQRVGSIPWLWTKDGDDIIDNHDDSGEDNWCVVGGVPGSAPALSEFQMQQTSGSGANALVLGLMPLDYFVPPAGFVYFEEGGTADAAQSGGEYRLTGSIDTTLAALLLTTAVTRREIYDQLAGREYVLLVRLYDAGSNLTIGFRYYFNYSTGPVDTGMVAVSTTTNYRLYKTPPFTLPSLNRIFLDSDAALGGSGLRLNLLVQRTSGSAALRLDFAMLLPRPWCVITGGSGDTQEYMYLRDGKALALSSTTAVGSVHIAVLGDKIELVPEKLNLLLTAQSPNTNGTPFGSNTMTIADTLTFNKVKVTPRYALL